ncbi:hypothetical protein OQI89_10670 [Lentilactobacillus diolivorans]|uniref:hypothetical protein n=1 Tax=Lentilactobacillus diolivorans TaxID=179838 RepID=UPI0024683A41|nr:hypothetical protein [Lentilactobacillus diolivorans]MDH5106314.1 hypothetical protein [Lentilactobacillus diolivorans]
MALLRSFGVWMLTYSGQCLFGALNKWHLESADFYMFYAVATLMMAISYVTGRIEEIKGTEK